MSHIQTTRQQIKQCGKLLWNPGSWNIIMKSKILWECLICAGQGSVADSEMNEHVSCIRGSQREEKVYSAKCVGNIPL